MKRFTAIVLSLLFALGLVAPAFAEDEPTDTTPPVDSEPPTDDEGAGSGDEPVEHAH